MIPLECAIGVQPALMEKIVHVESSGNPYAIGVVGGRLLRQPKNIGEAVATAKSLEITGYNYSVGTGQVNRVHFKRLGWNVNVADGFDSCTNLRASAEILKSCYMGAIRAGYSPQGSIREYTAIHAALSCYYSGSFIKGAQLGYVTKVLGSGAAVEPIHVKNRKKAANFMMIE